jgi:hypothetical protein
MEGRHITRIMAADRTTRTVFQGLGASDFLPSRIRYPSAHIFNTDKQSGPGIHWVSVYFDKDGNAEFFDSFGLDPGVYGFSGFLRRHSRSFSYNHIQLQSLHSITCGYFCIFFLFHRCRGIPMSTIVSWFDPICKNWNDHAVSEFVYDRFSSLMYE